MSKFEKKNNFIFPFNFQKIFVCFAIKFELYQQLYVWFRREHGEACGES